MPSFEEVVSQVAALSEKDLAAFRAWFDEFMADQWDRQIEADIKAGRLDKFAREARQDYERGDTTPL